MRNIIWKKLEAKKNSPRIKNDFKSEFRIDRRTRKTMFRKINDYWKKKLKQKSFWRDLENDDWKKKVVKLQDEANLLTAGLPTDSVIYGCISQNLPQL